MDFCALGRLRFQVEKNRRAKSGDSAGAFGIGAGSLCLIALLGFLPSMARAGEAEQRSLPLKEFRDRLLGGFVGQMVGVAYGAPYEFRYEARPVPDENLTPWESAMIGNALYQDDIYVDLTFLEALEKYGLDATLEDYGKEFEATKYDLWHANASARNNLKNGVAPPLSGHPRYNEHADDIDFQIEADEFGMISPGLPAAAQRMAWRAGHVMNYGDGVYGGVFIAAMYTAAFFEDDPVEVVRAGLAALPAESVYAKTIADALKAYEADPDDWQKAWDAVEKNWGDKVHCPSQSQADPSRRMGIGANMNGAYVAMGLLYGKKDPKRTIRLAAKGGRDADCNAASAMGVLGVMIGFQNLPQDFVADFKSMKGRKFAYTKYDWRKAVKAMEELARQALLKNGGEETETGGERVWKIPAQSPIALPLEQWPYDMAAQDVPLPDEGSY